MLRFLRDCGAGQVAHSGITLIAHLVATSRLMRSWGAPPFACDAALFHSVYGSLGGSQLMRSVSRSDIRKLIGSRAERLVFLYSRADVERLLECPSPPMPAEPQAATENRRGEPMELEEHDTRWLIHMIVANEIEQSERGEGLRVATDLRTRSWLLPGARSHTSFDALSIYGRIGRLLSWAQPPSIVEDAAERHRAFVEARIRQKIHNLAGTHPEAVFVWASLPPYVQEELFVAPESHLRLVLADSGNEAALQRYLFDSIAALHRQHSGIESEGPLWTPSGEYYFPGRDGDSSTQALIFDPTRCYKQTRYGRIVVDFHCPWGSTPFTMGSTTNRTHSQLQISAIEARLKNALELVRLAAPNASAFVQTSLRTLAFRASEELASSSSSWSVVPGRAVLENSHLASCTTEWIANAIVHESIHSFLYCVSDIAPIFERPAKHESFIESPWTGAQLAPSAYSHACLVWFGLWNMWRRGIEQNVVPPREANDLLQRSLRGFRSMPLEEACGIKEYWSPGFVELVKACQQSALLG
jgi:hypothetical protein